MCVDYGVWDEGVVVLFKIVMVIQVVNMMQGIIGVCVFVVQVGVKVYVIDVGIDVEFISGVVNMCVVCGCGNIVVGLVMSCL